MSRGRRRPAQGRLLSPGTPPAGGCAKHAPGGAGAAGTARLLGVRVRVVESLLQDTGRPKGAEGCGQGPDRPSTVALDKSLHLSEA